MRKKITSNFPSFGPIGKWKLVGSFDAIANKSLLFVLDYLKENNRRFSFPQEILLRLFYLAKDTSFSTQLLNSWRYLTPALSLNRTRLEQLIVSSYLIHEDPKIGMKAFINHIPIENYLKTKEVASNNLVKGFLDKEIDLEKVKEQAIHSMMVKNPDFDENQDKFEKRWSPLDLRSMAIKRDSITAKLNSPISKEPLEPAYITIYKNLSSIVHADGLSISPSFLGYLFKNENSYFDFMQAPNWHVMVSAQNAAFDLTQSYEFMIFLGINCDETYLELNHQWHEETSRFLKASFDPSAWAKDMSKDPY